MEDAALLELERTALRVLLEITPFTRSPVRTTNAALSSGTTTLM